MQEKQLLVRIVKMGFQPDKIEEFLSNFEIYKSKIRHFNGCKNLELLRDQNDNTVFFTYSYWDSEACLEAYRNSAIFKNVWARTKPLFNIKPEAWSVVKYTIVN